RRDLPGFKARLAVAGEDKICARADQPPRRRLAIDTVVLLAAGFRMRYPAERYSLRDLDPFGFRGALFGGSKRQQLRLISLFSPCFHSDIITRFIRFVKRCCTDETRF